MKFEMQTRAAWQGNPMVWPNHIIVISTDIDYPTTLQSMETDSDTSIPNVSVGSAGSSVSSRLQEEYQSLLKYALVTPVGTLADA